MNISTENGITVLTPDEGKCMVNNEVTLGAGQPVYLGVGDSPENWTETEVRRTERIIFDGTQLIEQEQHGTPFEQNGNTLIIDTKTYSGGMVYNGDPFNGFGKVEVTYRSDVDIPSFKVQFNSINAKTVSLKSCDESQTVVLEFEDMREIRIIDIFVNASAEKEVADESLKGTIVIEKICFVESEENKNEK